MVKVVFAIITACFIHPAFAQKKNVVTADTINVNGIVYGNDGKPTASICISAYKHYLNVNGFTHDVITDSTGRFQFKGLIPTDTLTIENYNYYSTYPVAGSRFITISLPLKHYENVGTTEVTVTRVYPKLARQFDLEDHYPHGSVDNTPEFPGGNIHFISYIQKTLSYPSKAIRYNIEGSVEVAFDVNRDGSFKNVRVLKGIGYGCDEEALRIVSNSPKWRPGRLWGRLQEVTETVTIQFKLTDK
ncbi:energy transducer TonB [Mucilaginibacter terrae]|uniref:energy transducer TonB n=1 Tax=Mucilaginibacter terrae TaxID=1955052 RepID=UPI00363D6EFB